MTKIISNSSSMVFSTNKVNEVEINTDNIIEADSEFREVVKKGYLLNQINLSTIPTIIQDALDKLIDDAKNTTLSDSLIQNLKQSLESLDDGIYKKTYIDNTITYLEDLLTSKVSLETVASITDNKIATATENLVTTSQAQLLTNRLGNSESEIAATKELINTKDSARANQITELLANINNAFAGYSEAIELYVDSQGNIKSEKIEKLELGNYLQKVSITEDNKIEIDERGNYTAISSKVIVNSAGEIVGFKITDTNDLSTFKINTDVFEIANSTNTFTPFRIEDNTLLFNGKVTFSNITGGENIVTIENVQNAINNNVTTIDGGKIVANSINANQLNANAISGKTISGGTITGTNIYGAYIEGSVIKASFIDLTSTQTLTNWQQYTPANYPSTYANNFAHNNDGTLLVDSLGYVRLMGNTNIVTQQLVYENNYTSQTGTFPLTMPTYSIDLYPYSDYKSNTLNRCITSNPVLYIPSSQKIVFCNISTSTGNNTGATTTAAKFYINNDYYEILATGTVASNSLSYTFSCSIKKNNVVIDSSTAVSGVSYTAYIGNLPISISVSAIWSYGLYPLIRVSTTNTLSSSTSINYTGVYGKAFQLTYAYSSNRWNCSIDVPAITING